MKTSHQLRQIANTLENLEETSSSLTKKEVWEIVSDIQIKLIEILETEVLFNEL